MMRRGWRFFLHHYVIAMAMIPVNMISCETVHLFSVAPRAGQCIVDASHRLSLP